MYYLPEPPYFLLVVGFVVGITCGLAFEATLKQKVNHWSKNRNTQTLDDIRGLELQLSFLGICVGVCVFLSSGLEVFLMNRWLAYAIALSMTILSGGLVWTQLGKLLGQLQQGGSKALELDTFG